MTLESLVRLGSSVVGLLCHPGIPKESCSKGLRVFPTDIKLLAAVVTFWRLYDFCQSMFRYGF